MIHSTENRGPTAGKVLRGAAGYVAELGHRPHLQHRLAARRHVDLDAPAVHAVRRVRLQHDPPGGQAGVQALADLLDVEAIPLDEEHGEESVKQVAYIREAECIGCTKCIQACPVDAILGAAKQMHTVIASECTGCDLCLEPCPVDCIEMIPEPQNLQNWHWPLPDPASRKPQIIATDADQTQDRAA